MTAIDPAASGTGATGPYHRLRVARVIEETADARSLELEIPESLRERFVYKAGQFLSFRVEVDGHRLVRCYSLASAPGLDPLHKVTVKRVVEGRVSNWMNDHVKAGDTLEVMQPAGVFCLRDRATPIVLFGGGSGITPVISILKTALATGKRSIKLVYANRDEASIIFAKELEALRASHPDRLEIVHRLDVVHGFVDVARVVAEVGDRKQADFYICGPGPFMDVVEQGLESLGVARDQIFIERFTSPSDAPAAIAPVETAGATKVTVKLDGKETVIAMGEGETILAAARRVGLEPPFACEEAYCGCCMAKVVAGRVEMRMNDGGIDQRQIDEGYVLTCQGIPKGDARIEWPD
ncbi:ferredoxin--NADP reductase [Myxococcota bacterium]|nr:ferredoxin--NADP reductase [Myxococcota bacterium]